MAVLGDIDIAETAWYGGFWGSDLILALAVAGAESGWNTSALNPGPGEYSVGLWQINVRAHPQFDVNSLYDQDYNAHAAFDVFHDAGYRWTPWSAYNNGSYQGWMVRARTGVNWLASMGNNVSGPAPGGQRTGIGTAPPTATEGIGSADASQSVWALSGVFNDAWVAFGGYTGAMESLIGL
jgi:hypothetical protein